MAKIKLRRDTYQNWYDVNPVLALGEPAYDTTNNKLKMGDGATTWRLLDYLAGSGSGGSGGSDRLVNGETEVVLSADGTLTIPGDIYHDTGINLRTDRGTVKFGNQPEVGGTSHFHIMRDEANVNNMDLYFGDDFNYVRQPGGNWGSGNWGVTIGTQDITNSGDPHEWRFGTDGSLTFPNNLNITQDGGTSIIGKSGVGTLTQEGPGGTISETTTTGSQVEIEPYTVVIGSKQTVVTDDGIITATDIAGSKLEIGLSTMKMESYAEPEGPNNTAYSRVYTEGTTAGLKAAVQDVYGTIYSSVEVEGGTAVIRTTDGALERQWTFGADGAITFPTQASNNRTGTGENLKFVKSNSQKIISTGNGTVDQNTVERLVIAGGDSYNDAGAYSGEGGDIYLWAGRGADGGDIKVDAGNGVAYGGTIKVRGGRAESENGVGGFLELTAGDGYQTGGTGGDITIKPGHGAGQDGVVRIKTGDNTKSWTFGADGSTKFPNNAIQAQGTNLISVKTIQSQVLQNPVLEPLQGVEQFDADITLQFVHTGDFTPESMLPNYDQIEIGWIVTNVAGTYQAVTTSVANLAYNSILISVDVLPTDYSSRFIFSSPANTWTFGADGALTFPDATVQSTAWNPDTIDWAAIIGPSIQTNGLPVGTRFTQPVPLSSLGQTGDTAGTVAFNGSYIYYCIQNFGGPAPVAMTVLASSGTAVWVSSADYVGDLVVDFTANSTGWTYNGVAITSIESDNQFGAGYLLYAATNWSGVNNAFDYNLQAPGVDNIWKRVAWSADTW